MIRCQLRCQGDQLDAEALLSQLPWKATEAFRKGEPMFQPSSLVLHQVSGFTVEIATFEESDFCAIAKGIEEFLCVEAEILARVAAFAGVDLLQVEMLVANSTRFQSSYRFPPSLLRLLADLQLPLEVVVDHQDDFREPRMHRADIALGLD